MKEPDSGKNYFAHMSCLDCLILECRLDKVIFFCLLRFLFLRARLGRAHNKVLTANSFIMIRASSLCTSDSFECGMTPAVTLAMVRCSLCASYGEIRVIHDN